MSVVYRIVMMGVVGLLTIARGVVAAESGGQCAPATFDNVFANTTVSSASMQPANAQKRRPAFCEVTAAVKPVPGSNIKVVVRLPDTWNGKLLGSGGGGWAGNVTLEAPRPDFPDGATPGLVAGYAVAQTNGGHDVASVWDTSWSSNPEAVTDFNDRAIHVMTDVAKAIVAKYYRRPHSQAYFEGCSTGGRQALMEVQRHPKDYDGVVAGAPVYTLQTQTSSVVRNMAFGRSGAPFTASQMKTLHAAVMSACDARDGLTDGIITDPRTCQFDPAALQCASSGEQGEANCLSAGQVKALRTVYDKTNSSTGETVSYPLMRGSELSWSRFISNEKAPTAEDFNSGAAGAGLGGLRTLVFNDASFNLAAFDPERDSRTLRASAFAAAYEAKDPDISAFVKAGGKLLMWHGVYDPGPSVVATVEYFERMQKVTGPKVPSLNSSVRMFLAPGVYHCRGGPGADQFDALGAVDKWVRESQVPTVLRATRKDGALTRPLCAYPALPRYKGKGDPSSADSFDCK